MSRKIAAPLCELAGYGTTSDAFDPLRADVDDALWRASVDPDTLAVMVDHGLVSLRGTVPRRSQVAQAVEAVQAIDGVIEVDDQLWYETDDLVTVPPLFL